jgi:excisionase family DNA binding protein
MTISDPELDLLTAKEVADILKMNPQVVLRKLLARRMPGFKLGKDWRVSKADLKKWLKDHSNQGKRQSDKVAEPFFSPDGTLKAIPAQRKKRVAVLEAILRSFEPNRVYPEKEVNEIIRRFHSDFCTIRREFIMEKMMVRLDGKYKVNGFYLSQFRD